MRCPSFTRASILSLAVTVLACGSGAGAGGTSPEGGAAPEAGRKVPDAGAKGPDAGGTKRDGGRDSATPHDAGVEGHAEAAADAATKPARPPGAYNLGMNVPGLNYFNNVAIYADMTLQMAGNNGPWDAENGGGAAPLDGTGAPTVAASAGCTSDYPTGNYTVTWDGAGTLSTAGLGPVTTTMGDGGVPHNTATLAFTQQLSTVSSTAWFGWKATPPVTNIHVMAPASEIAPGGMFLKAFAKGMHPFTTLRFMDTLNTNGNLVKSWTERTRPSAGSRANTPQGMAYEDIVAIANQLAVDVWINVPALATDDYVCRLARLFKYGEQGDDTSTACDPAAPAGSATTPALGPQSKVYVEYSNEIWNWGFQQIEDVYCMVWGQPDKTGNGKHCDVTAPTSDIGKAALADSTLPWSTNPYAKAGQFALVLVKRDSDIFRRVFGCASGAGCQAQIPMNVQSAYAAEVDPGFAFLKAVYGSASAVDVMAVAPYFNIDDASQAASADTIFAALDANLATDVDAGAQNAIANWIKGDLAEANEYGLPLVAYEGGQGLSGFSTTVLAAAETDPRMYAAYQTYFALWSTLVGKDHLFTHYNYADNIGSYGAWGALINQDDPGSQKWDALLSLTSWQGDANLDGKVDAADCAVLNASWGKTGVWWEQGDFNHDGTVDAADLALMNANIEGSACTH